MNEHQILTSFLVFGLLLTAGSAYFFMRKRERYRSWVRATGTVLELVSYSRDHPISYSGGGRGVATYAPRVSFAIASGEMIEFKSSTYTNHPPVVGSKVVLLYDPGNPREVVLDRFIHRHFPEIMGFAGGMVLLLNYVVMKFLA